MCTFITSCFRRMRRPNAPFKGIFNITRGMICCIILLFCSLQTSAQVLIDITVLDSANREPVAFVGIIDANRRLIGHTDLDGHAKVKAAVGDRIGLKSTGYKDLYVKVSSEKMTLRMASMATTLEDVVIVPGENPAHRLIWLAVKNRDIHNPQKACRHCYNAYNKLVFKPDEDSMERAKKNPPVTDSSEKEVKDFFADKHLFITESLTERYFNPPAKASEKIIANRVSGFQNPVFSILATELQSFGYYTDYIKLLGANYLNPISPGSTERYLFIMKDTAYENKDTIYTITFQPRKGKSFKGLRGSLSIHTDGYAIKNLKAEPVDPNGFRIFINQLYEKVQNKQWFPVQLNAKIYAPEAISLGGLVLHGDNKGYITNIRLGDDCEKKKTDEIALEIEPTERDISMKRLEEKNPSLLDEKERNTYAAIDSLGDSIQLDKRLNRWQQLISGKIPMGPINLDLNRILNYNNYEGFRLGLGLSTNYKISRRHSLSAYGAYGFKDKAFKYGSDLSILFYPRKQTKLTIGYRNDITEAAPPPDFFNQSIFLSASNARQLYLRWFDKHEQWQATLGSRLLRHFHVRSFLNLQHRKPLYDYQFLQNMGDGTTFSPETYFVTEVGGVVRFGFREKFVLAENTLISQGTKFPILTVKYTRSIDGIYLNDFLYDRIDLLLEKNFKIRNLGMLSVTAHAGAINGDVPYAFLTSFIGSKAQYAVSVPKSLETMSLNEFAADQYAMLFISHNFLSNLFYNTKRKPQLELFTSMAWGTLKAGRQAQHMGITLQSPDKIYYESGVRIHSLMRLGFTRLGIAVAYRYGPYTLPKFMDNLALRFTTGIVID